MGEDRGTQDKYILPAKYEKFLDSRHFTYISVAGARSGELANFVVWLPTPVAEVRARALAFIRRLYGRDLSYDVYQRTYVREARALARLGMHEDAPLDVSQTALRRYHQMWEARQTHEEERYALEEARLALERQNPKVVETGTYVGPIDGASLCVWRDQFGYTHAASSWMHSLKPGQRFIAGVVVDLPEGIGGPAPILRSVVPSGEVNILGKIAIGDAREVRGVTGATVSSPRTLVLSWQGEWAIAKPPRLHQEADPLLEAVEPDGNGVPRVVGGCAASLFHSKVTRRDALEGVLGAWGVAEDALDEVREWLRFRIRSASRPSPSRSWPLSRMAMPTWAELANLGERRVTLYVQTEFGFGRRRLEATDIQVTRGPYAQYTDAFFVRFKPRRSRHLRQAVQAYQPDLVVLLGWAHPDLLDVYEEEAPDVKSTRYASGDARWEREFDAALLFYLETHPLVRIALDLRGEAVHHRNTDRMDRIADLKRLPPEIAQTVVAPFASPASRPKEDEVTTRTRLFVSYHHARDAVYRARFEQDFHRLFASVSVYPGEMDARRSEVSLKRDIRARIQECKCLVVLISAATYTRKWVDYEIRTALDLRLPGGPRPIVGLLTPELVPFAVEIRAEIEVARSKLLRQDYSTSVVRGITETLGAQMRAARGCALPARLVDNLVAGHDVLAEWPADVNELGVLLMKGRSIIDRPVNDRILMCADLPWRGDQSLWETPCNEPRTDQTGTDSEGTVR